MKLLRTGILSAIVAVTLLASAPAMADPRHPIRTRVS